MLHSAVQESKHTMSKETTPVKSTTPPRQPELPDDDTDGPADALNDDTPRPSKSRSISAESGFNKSAPLAKMTRQSLLTQAMQPQPEPHFESLEFYKSSTIPRGNKPESNASTLSTAELTSDGNLTSPGTRENSPSPPLPPANLHNLAPLFTKEIHALPLTIRTDEEQISPLHPPVKSTVNDDVEARLGRKRCISFACGRKEEQKKPRSPSPPKVKREASPPAERKCSIRFACPSKISFECPSKSNKPRLPRRLSPAPPVVKSQEATRKSPRSQRGSDSTIRHNSPAASRKLAPTPTRGEEDRDLHRSEATRFHEFASSDDEVDDWAQESTVHRSRLTINDTLRVERGLQKLGEEAEEEAIEEEEAELDGDLEDDENDNDENDDDEEDEEDVVDEPDEDGVDDEPVQDDPLPSGKQFSFDDGWTTDNEEGFAGSDEDSDADSEYMWWAPGKPISGTGSEQLEHIRPRGHRSMSDSSTASDATNSSLRRTTPPRKPVQRKARPVNIRARTSDLPDSTDFVCGTLDEDRPLEDAYLNCLEQRRAAKHRAKPQDIDPTFPTSDPEMDQDDDEQAEELPKPRTNDADQLFLHGSMDSIDKTEARGRSGRASPSPLSSPKRMRSPAPAAKRLSLRSPPPRRTAGTSPRRMRSPAKLNRTKSPAPVRRISIPTTPFFEHITDPATAFPARSDITLTSSLPRTPTTTRHAFSFIDDDPTTPRDGLPCRGAIDIKEGLERKRARRRAQLYQKYCKKADREKGRRPLPGKGCERMREIGVERAAYAKSRKAPDAVVAGPTGPAAAAATAQQHNIPPTEPRMLSI